VENAARQGEHLITRLRAALRGPRAIGVTDVRGLGLMIGVELDTPARADTIADLCFRRGLLVLECGTQAIRISPPLILTRAQADTIADVFIAACEDAFRDRVAAPP